MPLIQEIKQSTYNANQINSGKIIAINVFIPNNNLCNSYMYLYIYIDLRSFIGINIIHDVHQRLIPFCSFEFVMDASMYN